MTSHPRLRTVVIGCVEFSHAMLNVLARQPAIELVGVVTRSASAYNADFRSLAPLAEELGLPVHLRDDNQQDDLALWLADLRPDVVFCMGWSYLLRPEVLAVPPLGVIGYHPSLLPRNRGRHPVIWALALGLAETGSTFFRMDEEADSGPILNQRRVPITDQDDASSLYDRLKQVAAEQLAELAVALHDGTLEPRPQDKSQATSWRKRGRSDGQIDWRMPARGVCNLVRALSRPYPGAHCMVDGAEAKIWSAQVGSGSVLLDVEPGQVLGVTDSQVTVKCGDGAVILVEHDLPRPLQRGEYL